MAGIIIHGAGQAAGAQALGAGLEGVADGAQARVEMDRQMQELKSSQDRLAMQQRREAFQMEQAKFQADRAAQASKRGDADREFYLNDLLTPDEYWSPTPAQARVASGMSTEALAGDAGDMLREERRMAKHKFQSSKIAERMAQLEAPIGPSGPTMGGDTHPLVGEFSAMASQAAQEFYAGNMTFDEANEVFRQAQRGQAEAQAVIQEKEVFSAAWQAKKDSLYTNPDGTARYPDDLELHFMTDLWDSIHSGDVSPRNGSLLMGMGPDGFAAAVGEYKRRTGPMGGGSLTRRNGAGSPPPAEEAVTGTPFEEWKNDSLLRKQGSDSQVKAAADALREKTSENPEMPVSDVIASVFRKFGIKGTREDAIWLLTANLKEEEDAARIEHSPDSVSSIEKKARELWYPNEMKMPAEDEFVDIPESLRPKWAKRKPE